jgi:uncharacterized membrane protein
MFVISINSFIWSSIRSEGDFMQIIICCNLGHCLICYEYLYNSYITVWEREM